jgi:hypothetical protein
MHYVLMAQGLSERHSVHCSYAAATSRTNVSPNTGPTSCIESGSPDRESPAMRDTAGWPMILNGVHAWS